MEAELDRLAAHEQGDWDDGEAKRTGKAEEMVPSTTKSRSTWLQGHAKEKPGGSHRCTS
jgi:ribosome modulation factor